MSTNTPVKVISNISNTFGVAISQWDVNFAYHLPSIGKLSITFVNYAPYSTRNKLISAYKLIIKNNNNSL